jgi:hypothetical protein
MDSEKPPHQCRRLRCWTTTLGVAFFVLAAACEIEAAFYTYSRAANFRNWLGQSSVTPDAIRMSVVGMMQDRDAADWCFYAGLALMMLGFACVHLGGNLGCSCRKSEA